VEASISPFVDLLPLLYHRTHLVLLLFCFVLFCLRVEERDRERSLGWVDKEVGRIKEERSWVRGRIFLKYIVCKQCESGCGERNYILYTECSRTLGF